MSAYPPNGPPVPYIQKDIYEVREITKSSAEKIRTALEYLAQNGVPDVSYTTTVVPFLTPPPRF